MFFNFLVFVISFVPPVFTRPILEFLPEPLVQALVNVLDARVLQALQDAGLGDVLGAPQVTDQFFSVDLKATAGASVGNVAATDPNEDTLSYSITSGNEDGAFAISDTGEVLVADASVLTAGERKLTISVSDGNLTTEAQIEIDIQGDTNAPPVAGSDLSEVNEDATVDLFVLRNDFDPDGDAIEIIGFSDPSNGVVALGETAEGEQFLTYTPNANFNGTDTFTYTIRDADGLVTVAQATVQVRPVNDPPIYDPIPFETTEDTNLVINVLNDATDIDGDGLVIVSAGEAEFGSVYILDNGTPGDPTDDRISYTPNANYFGLDDFEVTISDQAGGETTARVSISVLPENDAPVTTNDLFETDQDTQVVGNILLNDSDAENEVLSVISVDGQDVPDDGQPLQIDVGDGAQLSVFGNGEVVFDPGDEFKSLPAFATEQRSYDIVIQDESGAESTQTLTFDITGLDDPVQQTVFELDFSEDDEILVAVDALYIDLDNEPLEVSNVAFDDPNVISEFVPETGTITLPSEQFQVLSEGETRSFNAFYSYLQVPLPGSSDRREGQIEFRINIAGMVDEPIIRDDTTSTFESLPVLIDVKANDQEPDGGFISLSDQIFSQPQNGSVEVDERGTASDFDDVFLYTPDPGFVGVDTFTYGPIGEENATVTVTVRERFAIEQGSSLILPFSIDDPAPAGGLTLFVTTSGALSVPVSVTIPEGETEGAIEVFSTGAAGSFEVFVSGADFFERIGVNVEGADAEPVSLTLPESARIWKEGETTNAVVFEIDRPLDNPVTITYDVTQYTAWENRDYNFPLVRTVVIPAGETSVIVPVDVVNDNESEPAEELFIEVLSAESEANPVNFSEDYQGIRIEDNDPREISLDTEKPILLRWGQLICITIRLDEPAPAGGVTVDIDSAYGSTIGFDPFTNQPITGVNFEEGQIEKKLEFRTPFEDYAGPKENGGTDVFTFSTGGTVIGDIIIDSRRTGDFPVTDGPELLQLEVGETGSVDYSVLFPISATRFFIDLPGISDLYFDFVFPPDVNDIASFPVSENSSGISGIASDREVEELINGIEFTGRKPGAGEELTVIVIELRSDGRGLGFPFDTEIRVVQSKYQFLADVTDPVFTPFPRQEGDNFQYTSVRFLGNEPDGAEFQISESGEELVLTRLGGGPATYQVEYTATVDGVEVIEEFELEVIDIQENTAPTFTTNELDCGAGYWSQLPEGQVVYVPFGLGFSPIHSSELASDAEGNDFTLSQAGLSQSVGVFFSDAGFLTLALNSATQAIETVELVATDAFGAISEAQLTFTNLPTGDAIQEAPVVEETRPDWIHIKSDPSVTPEETTLVGSQPSAISLLDDASDDNGNLAGVRLTAGDENEDIGLTEDGRLQVFNQFLSGWREFEYEFFDETGFVSETVTGEIGFTTVDNEAPNAEGDAYRTTTSTALSVSAGDGVLANDVDPDSDPIRSFVEQTTENGTLTLNQDGSYFYFPFEGFFGVDFFLYYAQDPGGAQSDPVRVNIIVGEDDDQPPVSGDDDGVFAHPNDDNLRLMRNTVPNDPEGGGLTIEVTALPVVGTVYLPDQVTPLTVGQEITDQELAGLFYQGENDQLADVQSIFSYRATDPVLNAVEVDVFIRGFDDVATGGGSVETLFPVDPFGSSLFAGARADYTPYALSAAGGRVALGVAGTDTTLFGGSTNVGSVSVFRADSAGQYATTPPEFLTSSGIDTRFGAAVDLGDDASVLRVGAPGSGDFFAQGFIQEYSFDGSAYTESAPAFSPIGLALGTTAPVGSALAASGDFVVTGAITPVDFDTEIGATAYVYDKEFDNTFIEFPNTRLDANPATLDFDILQGAAVDVEDGPSVDTVIVGAPLGNLVYIWQSVAGARDFTLRDTVANPASGSTGEFGFQVVLAGDFAFVSDPKGSLEGGTAGTGVVHIFDRLPEGALSFRGSFVAPDSEVGDQFGHGLSVENGKIVVGAPGHTVNGAAGAGAIYAFDLASDGSVVFVGKSVDDTPTAGDALGFAVDQDGETIFGLAAGEDSATEADVGAIKVFSGEAQDGLKDLTIQGTAQRDKLHGALGDDLLLGEGGNDFLFGDAGNDTLFGGGGEDLFALLDAAGSDTVEDFSILEDFLGVPEGTAILSDVDWTQEDGGTAVTINDSLVVVLTGVEADSLTFDHFLFY